ncbi:hypothetical protein EWH99_09245 [Sporolactobacillus sp. THM7-7]|nr:hypothetical protein EWH99_09245 [Sporolactobacillus sp. THM7-7]
MHVFEVIDMSIDTAEVSAITFHTGKRLVALPIDEIQEIIEPLPAAYIPMTTPSFLGLITLRDKTFPLIDLAKMIHAKNSLFNKEDEKYVICSAENGPIALDVHAVGEPLVFKAEEAVPYDGTKDEEDLFSAVWRADGKTILLLDVGRLVEQTKKMNALERA